MPEEAVEKTFNYILKENKLPAKTPLFKINSRK